MKRIITAVSILLMGLIGTSVSAQSGYQVKGVVVDAIGPVVGATVIEKGTSNGTATGLDGDYVLTVSSPDAVVEISCIGYATQSFPARQHLLLGRTQFAKKRPNCLFPFSQNKHPLH